MVISRIQLGPFSTSYMDDTNTMCRVTRSATVVVSHPRMVDTVGRFTREVTQELNDMLVDLWTDKLVVGEYDENITLFRFLENHNIMKITEMDIFELFNLDATSKEIMRIINNNLDDKYGGIVLVDQLSISDYTDISPPVTGKYKRPINKELL